MSGTYILTEAGTGGDSLWRFTDVGNDRMHFERNGTMSLSKSGQPGVPGEWTLDAKDLAITLDVFDMPLVLRGEVSRNTIVLEHDGSVWKKG